MTTRLASTNGRQAATRPTATLRVPRVRHGIRSDDAAPRCQLFAVFFGITIRMYYDDHAPPHFHAYYQGNSAQISIETLAVLQGSLPRRALALVVECRRT